MSRRNSDDLLFKALADSRRREILDLLSDSPKTTSDLCKSFENLDRCTVMQHLGVLENAGLIFVRKKGKFRWNYLDVAPIREIYERWINRYASPSVALLAKLKRDIESK